MKGIDNNSKILDIGCSSGKLVMDVKNMSNAEVYGIDISDSAIKNCEKIGLENIYLMSGDNTTFNDNLFDIIIASDCLEHIEDDKKALEEWYRILKPNGNLLVFVPAWKTLWSDLDLVSHHFRRYSYLTFKKKLKNAGFNICRISFWNVLLFFPILVFRIIENLFWIKNSNQIQSSLPINFLNNLLKIILKIENRIIKKYNSPIGVSLFAICKKGTYEN